ncbi:MAG: ergothioneine biosynthesis protein EgtB [Phenylobacterium sp.]|uniref:ergothioneine biosynthesis protein EgtB n=1 Tax=Phenylobacterium sp. TaxID=1871053 RepID=UPI001A5D1A85|nr:ergothioneine biosynthesis protein EgtB [Phenylobacterium sp.]MBL8555920.1 ergothioneine biosynthesis protein EgtB [Phenylobacterium sp.]
MRSTDRPEAPSRVASAAAGTTALPRYRALRRATEALIRSLTPEDMGAQSMPDASPTKWHLAHVAWFFETFMLVPNLPGYRVFDARFGYLFNSYYEAVGPRQPRPARGLVTRPSVADVLAYRAHVDAGMERLLADGAGELAALLDLGLAHEEQHQELILMDILHLFAQSPLSPAFAPPRAGLAADPGPMTFADFAGGLVEIGHDGQGFAFDNEGPRHRVWLEPFRLGERLVTNAEWLAFIADGGYRRAELWLSDGWALCRAQDWQAPIYWRETPEGWRVMGLTGLRPLEPAQPVSHLSYFEADAYAAWAGARLPTEAEWEHAAATQAAPANANVLGTGRLGAQPAAAGEGVRQMFGDLWEWTRSAYLPYPGFRPAAGAVGEYNGKFMSGQFVLRGGACVTPTGHVRATYRNFFYPHQRWMFSGLRLAMDGAGEGARPSDLEADVVEGLGKPQKAIPPKHFYDTEGSRLFEAITELPEYYPTRTEIALLERAAPAMARHIPDGAALVEFGSGASTKTRILLDAAPRLSTYVPIDISASALEAAARAIRADYPDLTVAPLRDDFTNALRLPAETRGRPIVGFFPGSTIGNFDRDGARAFLESARRLLGEGAAFLVGIDLVKPVDVLTAAYDDAQGVTAAFNLNLLTRINRELGADFDLSAFRHRAVWNPLESRIEMHLESLKDQSVHVAGRRFHFRVGETLHTENSHKFTPEAFARLAADAGWTLEETWISGEPTFAIVLLRA